MYPSSLCPVCLSSPFFFLFFSRLCQVTGWYTFSTSVRCCTWDVVHLMYNIWCTTSDCPRQKKHTTWPRRSYLDSTAWLVASSYMPRDMPMSCWRILCHSMLSVHQITAWCSCTTCESLRDALVITAWCSCTTCGCFRNGYLAPVALVPGFYSMAHRICISRMSGL